MKLNHKILVSLLSLLCFLGISSIGASAKTVRPVQPQRARVQAVYHQPVRRVRARKSNWFTDGLSRQQLRARSWVTGKESGHHWYILSYGHRCVGYFQLDPGYLGRKNGHINLNKRHQVKVGDRYALHRYGGWVHAKRFWQTHHWY